MALTPGAKKFGGLLVVVALLCGGGYYMNKHKDLLTKEKPAVVETAPLQIPGYKSDQDTQAAKAAAERNGIKAEIVEPVKPVVATPAKKSHVQKYHSKKDVVHYEHVAPVNHDGDKKALEELAGGKL